MSTGGLPGFSTPRPNTPSNLAQATGNSTPTPVPGNVSTTEPGRIPVTSLTQSGLADLFKKADTAAKSTTSTTKSGSATGSGPLFLETGYDTLTTKPQGASAKDWSRYLTNTKQPQEQLSQGDIKFLNTFNSKYGTRTPTPAPGPGTTPSPMPLDPNGFVQGLGLLTRGYDNPFERRDLWRLFPNAGGQV